MDLPKFARLVTLKSNIHAIVCELNCCGHYFCANLFLLYTYIYIKKPKSETRSGLVISHVNDPVCCFWPASDVMWCFCRLVTSLAPWAWSPIRAPVLLKFHRFPDVYTVSNHTGPFLQNQLDLLNQMCLFRFPPLI